MSWIKQHSDILTHQKLYRLATLLGINRFEALGYVSGLWHYAAMNWWQNGDLGDFIHTIEPMLEWRGETGKLVKSLQESGLLDGSIVHEWTIHQAEFIRLKQRYGATTSGESRTKDELCPTKAVTDKIREDKNKINNKQTMPKPSASAGFTLPAWVDVSTWSDYVAMRAKIRKPMTDRAKALAVRDLEKLKAQGHDSKDVLEQSILNSWAGVFPLKGGQNVSAKREVGGAEPVPGKYAHLGK